MKRISNIILAILSLNKITGNEWNFPAIPINSTSLDVEPSIVVDAEGNAIAVWSEEGLVKASDLPLNGNWSLPVILSSPTVTAIHPTLQIDPVGNATVLWIENNSLKAAIRPPKGDWSEPTMAPIFIEKPDEWIDPNGITTSIRTQQTLKDDALFLVGLDNEDLLAPSGDFFGERQIQSHTKGRKALSYTPVFKTSGAIALELGANAIDAPSGGALSGAQIGFAAGTAAPTGGAVIAGQVGIATTSLTGKTLTVGTIAADYYTISARPTITVTDTGTAAGSQRGLDLVPTFHPTSPAANSSCISAIISGVFGPQVGGTLTTAAVLYLSDSFTGNAGTISNFYGLFFDGGTADVGTILNSYGGYFTIPSAGTFIHALHSDNLSVGSSYIAPSVPPIDGAIIEGNVGIGVSSPSVTTKLTVNATDTIALATTGTLSTVATNLVGASFNNDFTPSASTQNFQITCQPTFVSPGGGLDTINGIYTALAISGSGTIVNAYGIKVDPTAGSGATITNSYGGYFWLPTLGTNKHALHADNLSIGPTYVGSNAPPATGAIIQGNVGIGTTTTTAGVLTVTRATDGVDLFLNFPSSGTFQVSQFTGTQFVQTASATMSIGTSTNNIGLFTTNNTNMFRWDTNGGISVGIGFAGTAPLTNGAIIQGNTGIGTNLSTAGTFASTNDILTLYTAANVVELTMINANAAASASPIISLIHDTGAAAATGDRIGVLGFGSATDASHTFAQAKGVIRGIAAETWSATANGTYLAFLTTPSTTTTAAEVFRINQNGGIGVGSGFVSTLPPASGAIIQGHIAVGTTSPLSYVQSSFVPDATTAYMVRSNGTIPTTDNGMGTGNQLGRWFAETFQPPLGALSCQSIFVNNSFIAPAATTITTAIGINIGNDYSSNVGTISTAYEVFIGGGSSAGGTLTNHYGLFVETPVGGTNKFCAVFAGDVLPSVNKAAGPTGFNLGSTALRWNVCFNATNTTGTSRLALSKLSCTACGQRMSRGTGTLYILGETADYMPAWCCNEQCPQIGNVRMESIRHLNSARLAQRAQPPKIQFLGFKVEQLSGNSRQIKASFTYVDAEYDSEGKRVPCTGVDNATYLSDQEYEDFIALSPGQQAQYLTDLGLREWYALEEVRLLKEDCATLESELNGRVAHLIQTDLSKR